MQSYKRGFFQGNQDTISSVREDIKTLLLTTKGERVMHGDMGTNIPVLQGQLFEPITQHETFEKIRLEIEGAISTYLPFIKITSLRMITQEEEPNLGNNKIRLQMQYAMVDQLALSDTINITVKRIQSKKVWINSINSILKNWAVPTMYLFSFDLNKPKIQKIATIKMVPNL